MTVRLTIDGHGVYEVVPGATLLEACEAHGVPMDSACGGFAACNSCRVTLVSGALSLRLDEEDAFLDTDEQRLGCQARIVGDVRVRLDPGA